MSTRDAMLGAPTRVPIERPWWWPSTWDMGRAWQVWAMLMLTWGALCWLHGADAMAKAAWQACPWCREEHQS